MAYADGFSRDPAANSSPPPLGAPQGGLPVKRISATFRTAMAAIAECWNGATDGAVGVKNLRGMAVQDPGAVAITGGRIGANVVIEGGTALVWGLSPQQFYDALYGIGEVRWLAVGTAPVIPAAITAAWVQLASGFIVSVGTAAQAGTTVAGGWQTSDNGALAAVPVTTAAKALSMANLPAALQVLFYGQTGAGGQFSSGTSAKIVSDPNTGGDVGHTHDLVVPGASAHHHTLTPPQLYLAAWKRVS
jgi:hypothetical protein